MKKTPLLFLIFSILSCSGQMPLTHKKNVENEKTSELQSFQSRHLDGNVPYKVILPEDFHLKEDSLSLLVLLDGDDYSGIAKDVTSLYELGEKIYPTVIISLPSTRESRWAYYTPTKDTTNVEEGFEELYSRTGNFPQFANFLDWELIPSIEKELGVTFKEKTIFGHSLGGLGVLSFAVLRPELFQNYISASPSTMYDQHFIFRTIEENKHLEFDSMFLTAALNDGNGYCENVEWLKEYLDKHKLGDQTVGSKIYENESHMTSGLKSLIDGLEFIGK